MSPLPEDRSETCIPGSSSQNEYSPDERSLLIALAHRAITSKLNSQEIVLQAPSAHLDERRGVFTTLYRKGDLRGCVGYALPITSLYRAVAETARGAAFDDPRFVPVTLAGVDGLKVSLSILSRLTPLRPEEVEVGRHGLLVTAGARRGLLLPQVPLEHGWDRIEFLEQTCQKAGLARDEWKKGATLQGFTAEVFGEE
jgi:AmmeMemoRadiSam system protein A